MIMRRLALAILLALVVFIGASASQNADVKVANHHPGPTREEGGGEHNDCDTVLARWSETNIAEVIDLWEFKDPRRTKQTKGARNQAIRRRPLEERPL